MNTNKLLKCILISIIPIVPFKSAKTQSLATTYFVGAQKGKDANNGLSVTMPFKTISKAKETIRLLNKSTNYNITVNLRGGTYFQDNTLEFRQLYINGKRAIRARQPNAGKLYEIARWNTASRKAIVYKTEIMNWKNLSH